MTSFYEQLKKEKPASKQAEWDKKNLLVSDL